MRNISLTTADIVLVLFTAIYIRRQKMTRGRDLTACLEVYSDPLPTALADPVELLKAVPELIETELASLQRSGFVTGTGNAYDATRRGLDQVKWLRTVHGELLDPLYKMVG